MKKFIAALTLSAIAAAASAGVTGFTTYDYNSLAAGSGTTQELAVGVAVPTSIGTFDGAVVGNRYRLGAQDDALGFEVGYTNGLKLSAGNLSGRVSFGRKNQIDATGGGFKSNVQYYGLEGEFTAPLAKNVGVFAGYRHRNATNADYSENRFSAGVDLTVTKSLAARVGYAHTTAAGQNFNGVTTAVQYKF